MVDWRPILGILPPYTDAQWRETFELYRQSPEFQKINFDMRVEDFKGIFWLEYLHRLLGRVIGLAFIVPFAIFVWLGRIQKREIPKYLLMFVLGGLQGLLGWYMVRSGLIDKPHVSQYRLTAHLMAALLIYAYMFWVAMSLLHRRLHNKRHRLYAATLALTALITLTVISGGFVAGLKAGFAYNTFPLMGNEWIPYGMWVLEPGWRNVFDNLVTVQFDHRVLAMAALLSVIGYWFFARRNALPSGIRTGVHLLLAVTALQVMLGISTLILQVPTYLAATHQATAMILFTVALYLCHRLGGMRE